MLNSSFRYKWLAGGHIGEDIVSKAGSDSGSTSSHDGSKNDTDSDYITEPSITSAISLSFHVIISNIDSGEKRLEVHISV